MYFKYITADTEGFNAKMRGLHITPLLRLVLCCYEFIQMEGKVVYERMKEVNGLRSQVEDYSQRNVPNSKETVLILI